MMVAAGMMVLGAVLTLLPQDLKNQKSEKEPNQ